MEQWSHDPRSVVSTPAALRTLAGGAWRRATAAVGRSNLFSFDAFSADGANDKRASGDGSGRPVVPATYGSTLAGLSRFLLLFSATAVSIGDHSPGQFATAGQLNRSWLAGGDLNAGMLVLSPEGERETRRRVGGLEVELNACRTEVEGQTETLAYIADRVAALESMVMQHDHELAMRDRGDTMEELAAVNAAIRNLLDSRRRSEDKELEQRQRRRSRRSGGGGSDSGRRRRVRTADDTTAVHHAHTDSPAVVPRRSATATAIPVAQSSPIGRGSSSTTTTTTTIQGRRRVPHPPPPQTAPHPQRRKAERHDSPLDSTQLAADLRAAVEDFEAATYARNTVAAAEASDETIASDSTWASIELHWTE